MSQVGKDDMTTLRTASESLSTAESAEKDIQLKAVAFAINQAANTGEKRVVFQNELLKEVEDELKSKGYTVTYNFSETKPMRQPVISWDKIANN